MIRRLVCLLIIALSVLVVADAHAEEFGDCIETQVTIRIVVFDTHAELVREYHRLKVTVHGDNVKGFHGIGTSGVHYLFVMRPRSDKQVSDALTTIGHEYMHAVCGEWHK